MLGMVQEKYLSNNSNPLITVFSEELKVAIIPTCCSKASNQQLNRLITRHCKLLMVVDLLLGTAMGLGTPTRTLRCQLYLRQTKCRSH